MKKRRYIPDLVSDMAECDANYIRLLQLFPAMEEEDELAFGIRVKTFDGATVRLRVFERCRYTTMITVDVQSDDYQPWIRWPHVEIRMYHDLNTAEVVRFERHSRIRFRYETPNPLMFQPDEKAQINRFLGELMTFCIKHGHSLEPVFVG